MSAAALEESEDRVARETQALEDENTRFAVEARIKRDGAKQMERAIERLDAGLKVVNESIEGLAVRAPIAGRLTDFHLQLGEIVKPDQHIGRIDQPGEVKLVAAGRRVLPGQRGDGQGGQRQRQRPRLSGRRSAACFRRSSNGRFTIELLFVKRRARRA